MNYYYGWDISTAVIGVCIFDKNKKYLTSLYCDLRKIDDFNQKAITALNFVNKIIDNKKSIHFVEDKLSGFSGGGSNAGTIMKLAAFNALVSFFIWNTLCDDDKNNNLIKLHPSSVKSIVKRFGLLIPKGSKDKKELTLKWVSMKEPSFNVILNKNNKPQPYCFDMADAYITAFAGMTKV